MRIYQQEESGNLFQISEDDNGKLTVFIFDTLNNFPDIEELKISDNWRKYLECVLILEVDDK